jgi:hypothetical protein
MSIERRVVTAIFASLIGSAGGAALAGAIASYFDLAPLVATVGLGISDRAGERTESARSGCSRSWRVRPDRGAGCSRWSR